MSDGTPPRRSLSPDDRKLLVASLGILVAVFALVSSNVAANHSPKPHSLPIGIVGTPAVTEAARAELARAAPGAFEVHAYQSLTYGEDRRAAPFGLRRVPTRPLGGPAGRQRGQSPCGRLAAENLCERGQPIGSRSGGPGSGATAVI